MKTFITLVLVILFSSLAMAQDIPGKAVSASPVQASYASLRNNPAPELDKAIEKKVEVARLYRFKNSKVLKELTFTTKRNKAKLA